ncbi:hypothetical protein [Streptomyces anandii]|uniref:hypothetical protein n=1 Tax=Streptomyces anandii TaxID=285454 RepID=UPI000B24E4E6|nr:hypothetical protein [Streptomyces anandii]
MICELFGITFRAAARPYADAATAKPGHPGRRGRMSLTSPDGRHQSSAVWLLDCAAAHWD